MFANEKKQPVPKRFKELVRRQASVQRTEEAPMGLVRLDLECAVRSVLFLHLFILFSHTLCPLSAPGILLLVAQLVLIILKELPRCDCQQHLQYQHQHQQHLREEPGVVPSPYHPPPPHHHDHHDDQVPKLVHPRQHRQLCVHH